MRPDAAKQDLLSGMPSAKWDAHWDARRFKDTTNLQVGDVCLIKYDSEDNAIYRLCIIRKVFSDDLGIVRKVEVGFRPRHLCSPDRGYKASALHVLIIGVQRLIPPGKEIPGEALEREPKPKNKQSGEHRDPNEAFQENFAKDYSKDHAEVPLSEASDTAVPMVSVTGESTKLIESVGAVELAKSS